MLVRPFIAILLVTFRQITRQPAFLLATFAVCAFIAALPFLITHVLGNQQRMIRDSALALQLMAGMLLGCQSAALSVSSEIRQGTLSGIFSAPLSRMLFFTAKLGGLFCAMALFAGATSISILLAVRTVAENYTYDWMGSGPLLLALVFALVAAGYRNFRYRSVFASSGLAFMGGFLPIALFISAMSSHGGSGSMAGSIDWAILPACFNIGMGIFLLTGFAAVLSIRTSLIPTMLIVFGILMAGLMSDYFFGRFGSESKMAAMIHGIIPNWQHFWTADALHHRTMRWYYTGQVSLYTAAYLLLLIGAGVFSLARLEIKR